jgi:hypothetical protein
MLRQVKPEQRPRHVLEIRPHEVAVTMVDGVITVSTGDSRAYVPHDRTGYIETAMSSQPQSKPEVDVLRVTEKRLIESTNLENHIPTIKCGGCARRKNLSRLCVPPLFRLTMTATPMRTGHMVHISDPI